MFILAFAYLLIYLFVPAFASLFTYLLSWPLPLHSLTSCLGLCLFILLPCVPAFAFFLKHALSPFFLPPCLVVGIFCLTLPFFLLSLFWVSFSFLSAFALDPGDSSPLLWLVVLSTPTVGVLLVGGGPRPNRHWLLLQLGDSTQCRSRSPFIIWIAFWPAFASAICPRLGSCWSGVCLQSILVSSSTAVLSWSSGSFSALSLVLFVCGEVALHLCLFPLSCSPSQSSLVALIMDWFIGCVFSCVFSRLLGSRLWMIWCVIYVQRPVFSSHLLDPSFCLGNSFSGVSSSFIFVFVIFGLHFVLSFFFCPFCVPLDFFSKKP